MKVTVAAEGLKVSQHFGKTAEFMTAEIEDGRISKEENIKRAGEGHDALAGLLTALGTDVLITGGIGQGAVDAMKRAGIKVISGIDCGVKEALNLFASGSLKSTDECCGGHEGAHGGHSHEEGHECKCGKKS